MAQDITIFICDDETKAQEAQGFLAELGYPAVTAEKSVHFLYDATTYDGGTTEHQLGKWVVIGRK